jgi:predicted nucleotidyltransferase
MRIENYSSDTLDFLLCLYKHKVEYLIVGGEAVIYYGYPRLTGDIDFFYESSTANCNRLFDALMEFWEQDVPGIHAAADLEESGAIFQFGVPPNRIDLINQIDGVTFEQAWDGREKTALEYSGRVIDIYIIGLDQLIQNKESIKRNKDLDDLKYLRAVQKERRKHGT